MEDGQTSLMVIAQSHVALEQGKAQGSATVPLLLVMETHALTPTQPVKSVCLILAQVLNECCLTGGLTHYCNTLSLAGPTSVTLTRSAPLGDLEVGTVVTYTCTSSGGNPLPSLRIFVGSLELNTGSAPELTHPLSTDASMHTQEVKCEAYNDHGTVEDLETLNLFSRVALYSFYAKSSSYFFRTWWMV